MCVCFFNQFQKVISNVGNVFLLEEFILQYVGQAVLGTLVISKVRRSAREIHENC